MHSEKTTIGLRAERIAVRAALIMGLALATTTLAGGRPWLRKASRRSA